MDKAEAKKILSEQIKKLRRRTYSELCSYVDSKNIETPELLGESGTKYQLEIQAVWDDKPNENLRILVSIDDGGWRAFSPMTEDFIISPDGSFVGE